MTDTLQPILDELAAMRGLVEILSPLPPITRQRMLAWLTSVIRPAAAPTPAAPAPDRFNPGPAPAPPPSGESSRLAERIAALSRGEVPDAPDAGEDDPEKPRLSWRNKHV